jgi:predicted ATPase
MSGSMEDIIIDVDRRIYKFVITGGPCAGKTTAMERMQV